MDFWNIVLNPCCCTTLRTGAFIIAILEIAFGSILVFLAFSLPHDVDLLEITNFDYEYHREGLRDLVFLLWLTEILFASLLLLGIIKNNQVFVKVWTYFKISLIVLDVSIKLLMACMQVTRRGGLIVYFEDVLEYSLYIYFAFVIHRFFIEMRDAAAQPKSGESKLENL